VRRRTFNFEKAQERGLVQALFRLALPSDQIDTGADLGEVERRGHPWQQQHPEARWRSSRTPTAVPSWFRDRLADVRVPTAVRLGDHRFGRALLEGR
jgi:hypothetical protein